jgi:hypothetical protein
VSWLRDEALAVENAARTAWPNTPLEPMMVMIGRVAFLLPGLGRLFANSCGAARFLTGMD